METFLGDWKDVEALKADFWPSYGEYKYKDELDGASIVFASYTYECYSGEAFVLFERGGKLFEVNGSHCSCYGLEGQWSPEETTKDAILHRLDNGIFFYTDTEHLTHELREALKIQNK